MAWPDAYHRVAIQEVTNAILRAGFAVALPADVVHEIVDKCPPDQVPA